MKDIDQEVLAELGDLLATHYEEIQAIGEARPEIALGRYLRACRKWQVMTIMDVAAAADVPASEVLAYEQGLIPKRRINIDSLQALASILDEPIERFVLLLEADLVMQQESGGRRRWMPWRLFHLTAHIADLGLVQAHHLWLAAMVVVLLLCLQATHPLGPAPTQATSAVAAAGTSAVTSPPAAVPSVMTTGTEILDGAEASAITPVLTPPFVWSDETQVYRPALTVQALSIQPGAGHSRVHAAGAAQAFDAATATLADDLLSADERGGGEPVTRVPWQSPHAMSGTLAATGPAAHSTPVTTSERSMSMAVAPVLHTTRYGENLSCIAEKYYSEPLLYQLICLANFGETGCPRPLRTGQQLRIPTVDDLDLDSTEIQQVLAGVGNASEVQQLLASDHVRANQAGQRGIDYFCEPNDYENYGVRQVAVDDSAPPIP